MKYLLIALALTLSHSSQAFERPKTLVCSRPGVPPMHFTEFDTAEPNSDLPDAGLLDPITADATHTFFHFTNECDNSYKFLFFSADLARLAQGRLSTVTGLLRVSVADVNEGQFETVAILCEVR